MGHDDRILAGYKVVYRPEHFHHTLNRKGYNGYVYEHRYVVEVALGRPLSKDEIVHHKDGNKMNNDLNNLEVMSRSEHGHFHSGFSQKGVCIDCGKEISNRAKRCVDCAQVKSRKVIDRPSVDVLRKMVSESSYCAVARIFGVSDNAIRKWIKKGER